MCAFVQEPSTGPADDQGPANEPEIAVGLVADPGLPTEIARRLHDELPDLLTQRVHDGFSWRAELVTDELTPDSDDRVPIERKAHDMMPAHGWDLMLCVTDLPTQDHSRPVIADINTEHGVALASLPAIGWLRLRSHARDTAVHLIGVMAKQTLRLSINGMGGEHRLRRRPTELVSPVRQVPSGHEHCDMHLALAGIRGRARLLFGMVRDNRPWRLIPSLSKAIAASAGAAAFGIFYSTIWNLADALTTQRLAMINFFAIALMVGWLIIYNSMWERPNGRQDMQKTTMYNLATIITLFVGVACMYLVLFAVMLLGALAVISSEYLQSQLGHPVTAADYLTLV